MPRRRRSASMFIGPRTYSEVNAPAAEDPFPVRLTNSPVIRSCSARVSAPSVFATCMYAEYTDTLVVAHELGDQLPRSLAECGPGRCGDTPAFPIYASVPRPDPA